MVTEPLDAPAKPAVTTEHAASGGNPWTIVAGTGHRDHHLDDAAAGWSKKKILDAARWLRDEKGTTTAISGMATGFDLWWADAADRAGLQLHAYIPWPGQADKWSKSNREEWARLRAVAVHEKVFADRGSAQVMHIRNDAMLAAAGAVLALWIPSIRAHSGTWSVVQKSARRGMPAVHLNPDPEALRIRVIESSH